MAAASSLLDISFEAIRAAKAAGCRAVKPSGRTDCDALWSWLMKHPRVLEEAGDSVDRSLEITLKTRAERLLREHALAVARGEYIRTEQVQIEAAQMIEAAKAVLLPGPAALAPQVVGVSIQEAEKLLRDWLFHALSRLKNDPLGRRGGQPPEGGC